MHEVITIAALVTHTVLLIGRIDSKTRNAERGINKSVAPSVKELIPSTKPSVIPWRIEGFRKHKRISSAIVSTKKPPRIAGVRYRTTGVTPRQKINEQLARRPVSISNAFFPRQFNIMQENTKAKICRKMVNFP